MKFLGRSYEGGIFNSFRLIDGEIGRIMAAYCGNGIYLDVALFWVAAQIGYCPVNLRPELRPSNYGLLKLLNHFWRMVLCSGTRPLRIITVAGGFSVVLSFCFLIYAFYGKLISHTAVEGWTSLLVIISFFSGMIMVSLGVVAEYLALTMGIVIGKLLYIIASKPTRRL
jgi:undecaprenyl-phosphate 4-deoxy-4-formamido-L-arabinose transferase